LMVKTQHFTMSGSKLNQAPLFNGFHQSMIPRSIDWQ
jgi:hypothetical protein